MVSAFAKIKRLELLKRLFSKHHIVITPEVYEELTISLEYGYIFPLDIFRYFEVLPPLEEEREEYQKLLRKKDNTTIKDVEMVF